jgi:hypothetical protein
MQLNPKAKITTARVHPMLEDLAKLLGQTYGDRESHFLQKMEFAASHESRLLINIRISLSPEDGVRGES